MTHPTHLHHRSRKFWTHVEIARSNSGRPRIDHRASIFWPVVIAIIAAAMIVGSMAGCKSRGSEATRVTGTELVKAETYVKLSWQQATGAMKDWLNSALLSIHTASMSNERAAKEFDQMTDALADETEAHQKDNEKRDAEIKVVKATLGYRIEMFIRHVLSILKWICIGWAAWGVVAMVLGKFPATMAVGGLMGVLWRGFNSFIVGCLPHGTNAVNLVGRMTSIGVGDGSVAKTPPVAGAGGTV